MITIRKNGWEVTVDNAHEALSIMGGEHTPNTTAPMKRKYTKRIKNVKKYKIGSRGHRHTCARCSRTYLTRKENSKYCSRTCAGKINGHTAMTKYHLERGHNVSVQ